MIRHLVFAVLLAAFLGQGWAQASMAAPAMSEDCAEQMILGADCDCCPDSTMATGACAAVCSAAFALATAAPEIAVIRQTQRSPYFQPARAGPRYLPLNPPPIA